MKNRHGFVSNSSSASFVVRKHLLTPEQIAALLDYTYSEDNTDGWNITEGENEITGYTVMDNDVLDEFLEKIEVDHRWMKWNTED